MKPIQLHLIVESTGAAYIPSSKLFFRTFGEHSVTMVARDDLSFTLSHSIL